MGTVFYNSRLFFMSKLAFITEKPYKEIKDSLVKGEFKVDNLLNLVHGPGYKLLRIKKVYEHTYSEDEELYPELKAKSFNKLIEEGIIADPSRYMSTYLIELKKLR